MIKEGSVNGASRELVSRIQEGKAFASRPTFEVSQILKWYDGTKHFRLDRDRGVFEDMHRIEDMRIGKYAPRADQIKLLIQNNVQYLQHLLKEERATLGKRSDNKILNYWHSLKMSGPVKNAVLIVIGTIAAAIIGGIFLIVGASIQANSKQETQSTKSINKNTGTINGVQQQNGGTIINNFAPAFSELPGEKKEAQPQISMIGLGLINDRQVMVRLENTGGVDLPARTVLKLGLVPFNGNDPIKTDIVWLASKNNSGVTAGKSQSYIFDIPEIQKKLMSIHATFVVVILQSDLLADGIMVDIGYTWNAGQSWARYWENVGSVQIEQGKQIELFTNTVRACIERHLKDKEYDYCF